MRLDRVDGALRTARQAVEGGAVFARAGLLKPVGPGQAALLLRRLATWGANPAAAYGYAASLTPDRPAIVDEAGTLTFKEVERRTNALARGLEGERGGGDGSIGILARNHRGFIEGTTAAWKLGARAVFMNTAFAGPQLRDVARRERVRLLLHDGEFAEQAEALPRTVRRVLAWEDAEPARYRSIDDLIEVEEPDGLRPPPQAGRAVILTSGTTGTPRGAPRSADTGLQPAVALLSRIPLRAEETTLIAAPLFHAWGFGQWMLSLLLRSTVVLERRFDPESALAAIERFRPSALVVVPVMLQRILELPARTRRRYDTSSLRVVAASGSALGAGLATRFMDEFGDVLYNLYGSTEVAWAAIATPDELRRNADTAGRPPLATTVRIYRADGTEAEPEESGEIYVGNDMLTEGTGKDMRDGLMSTGDLGHFDADGLLFVEGRSDDMIVSGGENVYPAEVEDTIGRLGEVVEVAVIGVPDDRFGQALLAYVVRRGSGLTEAQVKDAVRRQLARYKVPRGVVFVESLPRNAAGKIVKRELPDPPSG